MASCASCGRRLRRFFTHWSARRRTMFASSVLYLVNYIVRFLIPGFFQVLESDLGLKPSQLGLVTFSRNFFGALSFPIWGWASDKYPRRLLVTISTAIWGFWTCIIAFATNFPYLFTISGLQGMGLEGFLPPLTSWVADFFYPSQRGKQFGMFGLWNTLGAIGGIIFGTVFADVTIAGFHGWRALFLIFGVIGFLLGLWLYAMARDPPRGTKDHDPKEKHGTEMQTLSNSSGSGLTWKDIEAGPNGGAPQNAPPSEEAATDAEQQQPSSPTEVDTAQAAVQTAVAETTVTFSWKHIRELLKNRCYLIIATANAIGNIPWTALSFLILWFQYIGLSDLEASAAYALAAIGVCVGSVVGGFVGDRASIRFGEKGRVFTAQTSLSISLPLVLIILLAVPRDPSSLGYFMVLTTTTGFFVSWCQFALDLAAAADIFRPEIRATAYGMSLFYTGVVSSVGSIIVGYLTEAFGYEERPSGEKIHEAPEDVREKNINALSLSLVVSLMIPWGITILLYFGAYYYYPIYRRALKEELRQRQLAASSQAGLVSTSASMPTVLGGSDEAEGDVANGRASLGTTGDTESHTQQQV